MLAIIAAIECEEDRNYVNGLYNKYNKLILWQINQRISEANVIEDLLQETIVHVIKSLDTIQALESYKIRPYIIMITKNVCIDYLRREDVKKRYESRWAEAESHKEVHYKHEPERAFENKENEEYVWRNVDKLSEQDKNIIICRFAFNMSYEEIAYELGINPKNMGTYVKRAKDNLKNIIKEAGNEF